MNQDELKQLVVTAIQKVAPEMEECDIDPDEAIREECDMDSMDFLNLLTALKSSSGVNIPEGDYSQVNTLNKMLEYISEKIN